MYRIKDILWSQRNRIKDTFLNQRNRIAVAWVMALVWWCVFYPELCFPQDTYEVVYDVETIEETDNDVENDIENSIDVKIADTTDIAIEENCPPILKADDEQIVIGSRLLEWLGKNKK